MNRLNVLLRSARRESIPGRPQTAQVFQERGQKLDCGRRRVRPPKAERSTIPQKPNIQFLQVDQLAAAYLRTYSNPICKADNIEALAAGGVVFDRAYCNFPLCAPSRFSMATGQLCSATGTYDSAAEMPATIPTYAHYLRTVGYQTALSGKMHFIGPDQFHGFEKRLAADIYPADYAWVPNWGREDNPDVNDSRTLLT